MKIYAAAIIMSMLFLITPVLSMFRSQEFYNFAYAANGAYERLGPQTVALRTQEFQGFLEGGPLTSFPADEASHLEDVRGLYRTGVWLFRIGVLVAIGLFFFLSARPDRRRALAFTLYRASVITSTVTLVLFLLALNWEWFFSLFHQLFFTGNYAFASTSLTMQLWGGNFFVIGAAFSAALTQAGAFFSYALSVMLYQRSPRASRREQ